MTLLDRISRQYSIRLLIFLLSSFFALHSNGQSSLGKLHKEADRNFESGDYRTALHLYRQAGLENSSNKKTRLKIGISMYEINDLDGANRVLQSLVQEGKTEAPVFFLPGKNLSG